MKNNIKTLAVIPARAGSKGLPGKNIKQMAGLPLIEWSIKSVLGSRLIDEHVISTDCDEIKNVSLKAGGNVPFLRPEKLAQDESSSIDVVLHALDFYAEKGVFFDACLLVEPTSPLRAPSDLDEIILQLERGFEEYDAVVSIGETGHYPDLIKKKEGRLLAKYIDGAEEKRRQEYIPAYFPFGVGYLVKTDTLRSELSFYPVRTSYFEISKWQCYEIDDLADFEIVEFLVKKRMNENE